MDIRRVGVNHILELAAVGLLLPNKGIAAVLVAMMSTVEVALPAFDESQPLLSTVTKGQRAVYRRRRATG